MAKIGPAVLLHLDKQKLEMLDELSGITRIPRSVLLRKAVDDLLEKHRAVWRRQRTNKPPVGNVHRVRLAKKLKAQSKKLARSS
jgi:hypothetical protein